MPQITPKRPQPGFGAGCADCGKSTAGGYNCFCGKFVCLKCWLKKHQEHRAQ